ncbi:hypothetical protein D6J61_26560 [Salmonella enterica subsp. enterica serovar Alachua]|nr:hypothetical protein [Salmonella enterica subsp. enterica serovar Alachua]
MLADMPMITADHLHTLIAEFFRRGAKRIVRAMNSGQLGNPVIFPRSAFHLLMHLEGDQGAGGVLNESGLGVTGIEIGVAAVADVDTVTDILDAGGVIPSKAPARDEADKLQSQVIRLK